MAGHSAFLSFDGPVQVIGPTGVLVAPVVQNGRHKDRDRIAMRYGQARERSGALP